MTQAKPGHCPTCRQPILAGPDNNRAALNARADQTPLTRTGELLAVLAGHTTYELAGGELYRRDAWRLTRPAPTVLPQHDCTKPIPHHWRAPHPAPRAAPNPEGAPF